MGFFDGIRISKQKDVFSLDTQKATLIIIYSAVAADEIVTKEERLLLEQSIAKAPEFENNSSFQDRALIRLIENYCSNVPSALDDACTFLSKTEGEKAFILACEAVFVDGTVTESEVSFIENLASKIGVSDELAKCAVNVFSVMYRRDSEIKQPENNSVFGRE